MDRKTIDNIVWWIPFRKLRNSVRDFFYSIYELRDIIENESFIIKSVITSLKDNAYKLQNDNFINFRVHLVDNYNFLIDNPDKFQSNIEEFKKNLDDESLEVLERRTLLIKSFCCTKFGYSIFYRLPYSTKLISEEQKIVYASKEIILDNIAKRYSGKYCINDIGLNLHVNYYESGIVYLPTRVKEKFKNSVAIDIGAFIGDTAIMFLEEHNFKIIHAFEPESNNFNKLLDNVEKYNLNDSIKMYKLACGNIDTGNFSITQGHSAGSAISKSENEINCEKIETVVVDDYLKDKKNISLIKIDTEGFEEQALKGCEKIIRKNKPVLLIAAYHDWYSPGQMFRLKKYIEDLNLGYKILYRHLEPYSSVEYDLICYVP